MAIKCITGAFMLLLALATQPVMAGNLDVLLSGIFPDKRATYIGYESVERKYLIVDFRFESEPPQEQLQANVHRVCMALLKDRELIRSLSDSGYDMVAVAFDRKSQFDCL